MLAILITLIMILLFAIIMEISATALKITGMDIHVARFHALSALTGTGFTTEDTEIIMHHRQRRRIVMILMVLGPIGLLTILGSMLINLKEQIYGLNVIGMLLLPLVIMFIFTRNRKIRYIIHTQIEKQLKKHAYAKPVVLEETLQLNKEYGVCELKIDQNSRFLGKMLQETEFKEKGLLVLAIKRKGTILSAPKGQDSIQEEDSLVMFGNLTNARKL